jgi:hypothetical protein
MDLALWIVAGLLAVVFLVGGTNKLVIPRERLARAPGGGWVNDFSPTFLKALGGIEVLGAIGLVVPAALGIAPVLVPIAAVGLAIIMAGAMTVTYRRNERAHAALNVAYFALACLVAWGRFGPGALSG